MKVIIAAGGTAGHINPALATAGEIKKRHPDAEILFIGTADKMEARLVPAAGYDFRAIDISGFWRSFDLESIIHNVKTVFKLMKSAFQVRRILKEYKPDLVLGFGGYVSGPVLLRAAKLGIPTAIHEQNAFPGVTNKTLAGKVDRVMLTHPNAEKYLHPKNPVSVTGLPVRAELLSADRTESRRKLGIRDDQLLILSMGGSLGADAINNAVISLISGFSNDPRYYFLHSTGSSGTWVAGKLKKKGVDAEKASNVELREYIDDMDVCMSAADLVICRAGASSLSEIQALGKPSILIPSPYVSENHQFHNAMALVENGAAKVIEEKDLTEETVTKAFLELVSDEEILREYGENARKMAISDAKEKIADIALSLVDDKS